MASLQRLFGRSARDSLSFKRAISHKSPHVTDYTRILGLTIAHELGHIVLPTSGHSDSGIMNPHVYLRSKYNLVSTYR